MKEQHDHHTTFLTASRALRGSLTRKATLFTRPTETLIPVRAPAAERTSLKTDFWNNDYRVDTIAWLVVGAMGLINLFRGSVHTFLPDGGAGVIAGFDLTHARQTILFLFAVMGVQQLSVGVVDLIIASRVRMLALPALWFHTLEQTLGMAVFHFYKPAPGRPPGMVGGPIVMVILWVALGAIYWRRSIAVPESLATTAR